MSARIATLCSDPLAPRVRIVATAGPATFDNLEDLLRFGTVRMNMAYYDREVHSRVVTRIRERARNNINIMVDAVGPRVKLSKLPEEGILLREGAQFIITTRSVAASDEIVGTIFHELPSSVRAGEPVLLAEGRFRLEVVDVRDGTDVVTRVVTGGLLKKRGINLPRSNVQCPALSDQDRLDLADMLALPDVVDMVALSFVRSVADVEALREYLRQQGRPDVRIMSKIETQQAVDNIDAIAAVSDALMVARGDLWCEIEDPWSLPRVTCDIITAGRRHGIPVITATQVTSSMVTSDMPSRAEVDELYFLMQAGSDCVMGSEEFTIGKYPAQVIRAFQEVSRQVDREQQLKPRGDVDETQMIQLAGKASTSSNRFQRAAAVHWANVSSRIQYLLVISDNGSAARAVYRHQPQKPLVIITNNPKTARFCQLMQVLVVLVDYEDDSDPRPIAEAALRVLLPARAALAVPQARPAMQRHLSEDGDAPTALLLSHWHAGPGRSFCAVEEVPFPAGL